MKRQKFPIVKMLFLSIFMLYAGLPMAQTFEHFEFDTTTWVFPEKYQIVEFEGKHSLLLERSSFNDYSGYCAYLKGYDFSDGIIEFDLFCPEITPVFSSGVGFVFRLTTYNEENRYEVFYFRTHLSNAMRSVQYMPVNNGTINWTNYVDFVYNSIGDIPSNEWVHIKAEIEGPRAVVYVNDKEVMTVNNLGRGLSDGSAGVWLGNTVKCYYTDFKVAK